MIKKITPFIFLFSTLFGSNGPSIKKITAINLITSIASGAVAAYAQRYTPEQNYIGQTMFLTVFGPIMTVAIGYGILENFPKTINLYTDKNDDIRPTQLFSMNALAFYTSWIATSYLRFGTTKYLTQIFTV